jgi:NADH dehydrogenase FAD-containing subunit
MSIGSVINDFGTPGAGGVVCFGIGHARAGLAISPRSGQCIPARQHPGGEPVRRGQLDVAIIGAGASTELAVELHRTVCAVVAYGLNQIHPERDIHMANFHYVIGDAPSRSPLSCCGRASRHDGYSVNRSLLSDLFFGLENRRHT